MITETKTEKCRPDKFLKALCSKGRIKGKKKAFKIQKSYRDKHGSCFLKIKLKKKNIQTTHKRKKRKE